MAKPYTRRNAGRVSTNSSNTSVLTTAISWTQTPAPTQASALGSLKRYTDEDLQRATKLALKLFVKGQQHS